MTDATVVCGLGHSFDIARQGYVNFRSKAAPGNADTATMLHARDRFLATGHYRPIQIAASQALGEASRLLEVGAGTGYYLAGCLDALPAARGLATDVSPAAARLAARAHPRAASAVADTWEGLPLLDRAVDAVLCVFAPRNPAEFARVLQPGGVAVIVVPRPEHLAEVRRVHGLLDVPADKASDVARRMAPDFTALATTSVTRELSLNHDQVGDLIGMGPNAFHAVSPRGAGMTTWLAVDVVSFQRR